MITSVATTVARPFRVCRRALATAMARTEPGLGVVAMAALWFALPNLKAPPGVGVMLTDKRGFALGQMAGAIVCRRRGAVGQRLFVVTCGKVIVAIGQWGECPA